MVPYTVVSFLLLLLLLVKFFVKRPKKDNPRRQAPSPAKLPIIGNLHQLGSLPHRSLTVLSRKHGHDLMLVHLGSVPYLVVSSEEMAREIMKTHDLIFCDRPPSITCYELLYHGRDVAFSHYGDYWRQVRKICVLRLLSSNRVESYRSVMEEEVSLMTQKIANASSPIDIGETVIATTNGIISRVAFGGNYHKENGKVAKFRHLLAELSSLMGTVHIGDIFPTLAWAGKLTGLDARLRKNFQEWDEFLDMVIEEHLDPSRARVDADRQDFVDILLDIEKKGETGFNLGRDGIKALILDNFAAGTETIQVTIVWLMAELMKQPRVLNKVQEEIREVINGRDRIRKDDIKQMDYLKSVLKETLRMHPPGPLLVPRQSMQNVQVQEYYVPAKTRVLINAWAIGRDPKSWDAPDEFWPERFVESTGKSSCVDFRGHDFQLIPFGAGRRICPGISYATTTMELALVNLLHWFDWELASGIGEEVDMDETFGITVGKKNSLLLIAKEHFK